MPVYRFWEYDCDNGDVVANWEERTDDPWKVLEAIAEEAQKYGWEIVTETDHSIVFSIRVDGRYIVHEVGFYPK